MERQPHILFVDDEQLLHNLVKRLFSRHGIEVTSCINATQAMDVLKKQAFDLVVTDFKMPDVDGVELLVHIRKEYPDLRVIMVTAHANVQHAVRTMQHGAIDYMPKPFSTAELVERVQACLRPDASPAEPKARKTSRSKRKPMYEYIGESPAIKRLKEMLPRLSQNKAPIFIQGESGTGKEILARMVHEMSDRADGPYITINCANLPRELVESHLFGHLKGSFTDAKDDRTGAFEEAHGGTLLLDEITEIEMSVQAKLLRVLQEQEFQKVGSTEVKKVDVRVVATSNRNVGEAMQEGSFREDLYHRLSVFPIQVPPLRERMSDIPMLAKHFVKKYCDLYEMPVKTLDPGLIKRFQGEEWMGNVRQLENMVQRGVLMSMDKEVVEEDDVYDDEFFPQQSGSRAKGEMPPSKKLEVMEFYMIEDALKRNGNNQQRAAEELGISSRTIRNKQKRYKEVGWIEQFEKTGRVD